MGFRRRTFENDGGLNVASLPRKIVPVPLRRDYSKLSIFVELKVIGMRPNMYFPCDLEDRLEPDSFLSSIAMAHRLRTLTYSAKRHNVGLGEPFLIAVHLDSAWVHFYGETWHETW